MPRGYPDYFGQQMFPKYGGAKFTSKYKVITTSGNVEVLAISGKGRIYGGYMYTKDPDSTKNDRFRLRIDGETIPAPDFEALLSYGHISTTDTLLYIIYYDELTPKYVVGLKNNITFDYDFAVLYNKTSANDVTVEVNVYYTLIE